MNTATEEPGSATDEDRHLKQKLGYWSLVATGVGSVIGSGWLFSAMYAAQTAGPAALVAWVIGGAVMLAVALVFAELGMVRPESGGLVRYPLYSNGRFAASIVGWSMWVTYVANPPTEASGVVQYASSYLPGLFEHGSLTFPGILVAIALMAVFVVINFFGVQFFARSNNVVTAVKICIPTLTIVLLLISGFTHTGGAGGADNIAAGGGFAPYGFGAALGTIATAGMVFAYTGFRNIIELSGEVKDPRRNIPASLVTTILGAIVLYLLLQIAFVFGIPQHLLGTGWGGIDFDSPFAQLAMLLGMTWLYWVLIADSMVSPSGSGIVFTASNARNVFGLAKNRFFPEWLAKVHPGSGVPRLALVLNFLVGILFLLPLPSWHAIIGVTGTLIAFTFSIGSVSLVAFRRSGVSPRGARLPGMTVIAPFAFIVSALVIYWVPWSQLVLTIPIVAVGFVWYAVTAVVHRHERSEIAGGVWLVVYLVAMYGMAAIGGFGGLGLVPAPWDSIAVALVAAALYVWGTRSGVRYMRERPALVAELRGGRQDQEVVTGAGRG
ncbi:APC family permease [Amnibacterium kyonggiense]|uniref:Amino acid/polyamine/organocation transporter (APC superfamily) n=1 Tax=Amnibacterium kyonggiense TaxID=595671 RepID=A0A4R7FPM3_9MICO|nr:APC family permease [Amnibacterium kyonggiense]TDS79606.1 amino acid/polyamine/organocation transporter (APC superfamily) [Amnibacterium kyonggiense]